MSNSRRFLVKEIALQAGVGTATVDRVLNDRGGVRQQTVQRVRHAIEELERQQRHTAFQGRKFMIDSLVEAPEDFANSFKTAAAAELPLLRPVVFRMRTDIRPHFPIAEIERSLDRIRRRGSHGVILMAPDARQVRAQIDQLTKTGIPIVTFATDIPESGRLGYVGLDNRQAGETAAFLMRRWLTMEDPHVLITIRNNRFRGEEDRELGFRSAMRRAFRRPRLTELVEDPASGQTIQQQFRDVIAEMQKLDAVYSIGGRNREVLQILEENGRRASVFLAHDMYAENRQLLASWKIDTVIDHDFREDLRNACRMLMSYHGVVDEQPPPTTSPIRIVVPPMLSREPEVVSYLTRRRPILSERERPD